VIEKLADFRQKDVHYISLKTPILIIEFIVKNKKGTFLLNSDEHLCYYKNGKLKDSFYNQERKRLTEDRLLGYWEIKDKEECSVNMNASTSSLVRGQSYTANINTK